MNPNKRMIRDKKIRISSMHLDKFLLFFKTRVICVVKTYKVLFLSDIKFKLENVTKFEKSR